MSGIMIPFFPAVPWNSVESKCKFVHANAIKTCRGEWRLSSTPLISAVERRWRSGSPPGRFTLGKNRYALGVVHDLSRRQYALFWRRENPFAIAAVRTLNHPARRIIIVTTALCQLVEEPGSHLFRGRCRRPVWWGFRVLRNPIDRTSLLLEWPNER